MYKRKFLSSITLALITLGCSIKPVLSQNPMVVKEECAKEAKNDYRVAINPTVLQRKLLESKDQNELNSAVWQASESARQKMLLSLFRMNLFSKSRNAVHILLGQPSNSKALNKNIEDYELGNFEGEQIALQIHYYQEKPNTFYIVQHSESGYLHFKTTDWYWKDPEMKDAARDFNRSFLVVGCPVQHLCQIMGHPQKQGDIWKCGTIELEYTPDKQKVKRFRMTPDQRVINVTTDWETADLRTVDDSYATSMSVYLRRDDMSHLFNKPILKFDRQRWDKCWNRDFMLFDLGRNFKLIGRTRTEIRNYLGEPTITENQYPPEFTGKDLGKRFEQHMPYTKFDWYPLKGTGCCIPADPGLYLELVYNETEGVETVAGYRAIESDVFRDGQKEIYGVAFNELYGLSSPQSKAHK